MEGVTSDAAYQFLIRPYLPLPPRPCMKIKMQRHNHISRIDMGNISKDVVGFSDAMALKVDLFVRMANALILLPVTGPVALCKRVG